MTKKLHRFRIRPKNAAYFFMAPGIILFTVFGAYPIIASFVYSFQERMGTKASHFVGLTNYIRAFHDELFLTSLKNILVIFIMHAPLMVFIALLLAHVLNVKKTRFKTFFRTMLFLPNVTNAVAFTMLFRILLSNDGILNEVLGNIGLDPVLLLSDPYKAKWVIAIMTMWRWTGYNMIILLAAMQSIPADIHEAADIDGANKIQQFFRITVPLMKNPIIFTTIMTVSGTINMFAESQLLANGGPSYGTYTPALLIYTTAWKQYNFGYASALSYVLSIITIIIAFIQFRVGRERD